MSSRQERFDRADFERPARTPLPEVPQAATAPSAAIESTPATESKARPSGSEIPIWPIEGLRQSDIGDTVMKDRRGRPHNGIDLHAPEGTAVIASRSGRVLRIVDGRKSTRPKLRRAGLFVDIAGLDGLIYRYLHLGTYNDENLKTSDISQRSLIGTIAAPRTSGLGKRPQLHFEIRTADYSSETGDYGPAINPLRVLPKIT